MNRALMNNLIQKIKGLLFFGSILFTGCQSPASTSGEITETHESKADNQPRFSPSSFRNKYTWCNSYDTSQTLFARINPPANTEICTYEGSSFASWLQHLPLLPPGSLVKSYEGRLIPNQNSHTAVINIDVGEKNLQQCADAAIRLRAEYLFSNNLKNEISFTYTNGEIIPFSRWRNGWRPFVQNNKTQWSHSSESDSSYVCFKNYLLNIFNYAGSLSLSKELKPISSFDSIQPGDVLVEGGNPGHVMTVVEIAINKKTGRKYYLLCQSFMPAQNIHIVKNHNRPDISPWYDTDDNNIITPGWTFEKNQLMRWR